MKLNLGFEAVSYSGASKQVLRKDKHGRPYGEGKTSAQVAKELEKRYKIVETFYEINEDYIVNLIEEQAAIDIDDIMMMKKPSRKGMSFEETDKIEHRFKYALASGEFDGLIPGTPTTAAQRGVSHLRRHPYAKRGPRPSFIDTDTYRQSFTVWMEE